MAKVTSGNLQQYDITFIMPAYNASEYIVEAVNSVINQTVTEWQLLIIDDCSTDSTMKLAVEFENSEKRIKVLQTKRQSGGALLPRMLGALHASTKWIAPIDADDTIEPDYLRKIMQRVSETGAQAVFPTIIFDPNSSRPSLPEDKTLLTQVIKGRDAVIHTLDGWTIGCNGGVIEKDSYLNAFSGIDETLQSIYLDELHTRRLLYDIPTVAFAEARYIFRNNCRSITRAVSLKNFDFLPVNLKLLDFTYRSYGPRSAEFVAAQRQNFHGIFDALELLNRNRYNIESESIIMQHIQKAADKVDLSLLEEIESRNYLFIFRRGLRFARFALRFKKFYRLLK